MSFSFSYPKPVYAHIFDPKDLTILYRLCVVQLGILRGINTVTRALLKCVYLYSTELGATPSPLGTDFLIDADALLKDKLQNRYIAIGLCPTDILLLPTLSYVLFTGIITGVNIQVRTTPQGTTILFSISCAAPIQKLTSQRLGGSWYYAPQMSQVSLQAISELYTRLSLSKQFKAQQSARAPIDIVQSLTTLLSMQINPTQVPLYDILLALHKVVFTSIGKIKDIPDGLKLAHMLDSSVLVRPALVESLLAMSAKSTKAWSLMWALLLLRQLCSSVATSLFMSAINQLTQDTFRMLQLVPVPLRLQKDSAAVYTYDAPVALMRIVPRSSILLRSLNVILVDSYKTHQYAIDSVTYRADYLGSMQRPDLIIIYVSNAAYGTAPNRTTNNLTYIKYPKLVKALDGAIIRRQQILAPDWLNWTYLHILYKDDGAPSDVPAVINPYAEMLYALLFNMYGTLQISGAIVDVLGDTGVPFDSYIGKMVKVARPMWTFPITGSPHTQLYYTGRVLSVSITYQASATADLLSSFRYSATVRVIPDSVRSAAREISNNIYEEEKPS